MPSDLTPATESPGIHISGHENRPPAAAYACRCGRSRTARGLSKVLALIAEWEEHLPQCRQAPAARLPAPRTNPTNRKRTTVPAADDGGLF